MKERQPVKFHSRKGRAGKGRYPSWIARVDGMTRVIWLPIPPSSFSFSFAKVTYVGLVYVRVVWSPTSTDYILHNGTCVALANLPFTKIRLL